MSIVGLMVVGANAGIGTWRCRRSHAKAVDPSTMALWLFFAVSVMAYKCGSGGPFFGAVVVLNFRCLWMLVQEVDLSWMNDIGPAVTDAGLIKLMKHAKELQSVKLAWCNALTDRTAVAIGNNLYKVRPKCALFCFALSD